MRVVAVRTNSRSTSKRRRWRRAMSCTAAMRPVADVAEAGAGLEEATMDWGIILILLFLPDSHFSRA
jgi:hypothetical protein